MTKKYTFEEVKLICKENGFELLEKEYVNCDVNMKMKCENGHIIEKRLDKVRKTKCGKCKNSIKLSFEEVKENCLEKGFRILDDEYKNARTKMKVICEKGHITQKTLDSITQGVKCKECYIENILGENHHNWNEELTDEERNQKRITLEYKKWRDSVLERDNYKCIKCNCNKKLHAHHIFNHWSHKELRLEISNGITFCEECHKKFHKKYGFKYNDDKQVKEFLS